MLEESNYTLTRLDDGQTALRLVEVVFFGRSGRSSQNLASRRQSFGSGITLLGIFGAAGLASGLGDNIRASGYFLHVNRGKTGEREEKIATLNGWPFKSIYRANLALATSWQPFSTSWAWSSLHTSSQVASGGLPEVLEDFPRRGL